MRPPLETTTSTTLRMKKFVIAIDSFKGCISSEQANAFAAEGVRRVFPDSEIVQIPVADGGEGFAVTLASALHGEPREVLVDGPLRHNVKATYFFNKQTLTAVMDSAQACGLTLVPGHLRNPLESSSFGVGEMIMDAINNGAKTIIIGLGGTATNDGGTGMLSALGVNFFDAKNNLLRGCGRSLEDISKICCDDLSDKLRDTEFIIASDVNNPLLGHDGATYTFGPQKGADTDAVDRLEAGMSNFARVTANALPDDYSMAPGAGAAGGLGFAFLAFLNGKIKSGVDIILDANKFEQTIKNANLIITGEGSLDAQTCKGKTALGILSKAKLYNIPVIAIGGQIKNYETISKAGFLSISSIIDIPSDITRLTDINIVSNNIRNTIEQLLRIYNYNNVYHIQ